MARKAKATKLELVEYVSPFNPEKWKEILTRTEQILAKCPEGEGKVLQFKPRKVAKNQEKSA
jgi:hypothetical protein